AKRFRIVGFSRGVERRSLRGGLKHCRKGNVVGRDLPDNLTEAPIERLFRRDVFSEGRLRRTQLFEIDAAVGERFRRSHGGLGWFDSQQESEVAGAGTSEQTALARQERGVQSAQQTHRVHPTPPTLLTFLNRR